MKRIVNRRPGETQAIVDELDVRKFRPDADRAGAGDPKNDTAGAIGTAGNQ
jgi:hypothetical protein